MYRSHPFLMVIGHIAGLLNCTSGKYRYTFWNDVTNWCEEKNACLLIFGKYGNFLWKWGTAAALWFCGCLIERCQTDASLFAIRFNSLFFGILKIFESYWFSFALYNWFFLLLWAAKVGLHCLHVCWSNYNFSFLLWYEIGRLVAFVDVYVILSRMMFSRMIKSFNDDFRPGK